MAELDETAFESKYNNSSTGLFKTGQNRGIGSDDQRSLVTDLKDSVVFKSTSFFNDRGDYDLSATNDYPTGGGSGSGGAIIRMNSWIVSVAGTLDVNGLGVIDVYPGAILISLANTPGTTPANWKVIQ